MIGRLSGTVWSIGDNHVVVRVGGVGFQLVVPSGALEQLASVGQPVDLFTHLHVRENELALYGFLTEEEVALFRLLLSVSGVGPKVAVALLGIVSPDALRHAVSQDEPAVLSRVPGIGQKTARAIIFHLKDRIAPAGVPEVPLMSDEDAAVVSALTGLGFSLIEAQAALQSLPRDDSLSIEERVRQALAYFAAP